ncbi:MAG: hypothetical protein AAGD04_11290 [Pseudomonadota bacterium]
MSKSDGAFSLNEHGWFEILAVVLFLILLGFALGKADEIKEFATYHCPEKQYGKDAETYEVFALAAVNRRRPNTDLRIVSTKDAPPDDWNFYTPTLVFEITRHAKKITRLENNRTITESFGVERFTVHVDGCGGATIQKTHRL